eukprot:GHVQ01011596.1.p1 GENE.GHVQ01011596.1~~GHVQ01011596.1.p1  ORF type:complete len:370 (+),score=82.75 GHVQ01011596.1:118-1227(+)
MASVRQMRAYLSSRGVNIRALLEKCEVVGAYRDSLYVGRKMRTAKQQQLQIDQTNNNSNYNSNNSNSNNNSNNSNSNSNNSNSNSNNSNSNSNKISSYGHHVYERKIGELNCLVKTNCADPDIVICVLHGFGANKEDLSSVCDNIIAKSPVDACVGCAVVVPDGCLRLMEGSYGWWQIEFGRLARNIAQGNVKEIVDDKPDGLPAARATVMTMLTELCSIFNVTQSQIALWGFSQGSMLSLDLLMHLDTAPLHLGLFSCGPMCQSYWRSHLKDTVSVDGQKLKKSVSISQRHGTADTIIPVFGGVLVDTFLREQGFNSEYQVFNGGHTLPPNICDIEAKLLKAALDTTVPDTPPTSTPQIPYTTDSAAL